MLEKYYFAVVEPDQEQYDDRFWISITPVDYFETAGYLDDDHMSDKKTYGKLIDANFDEVAESTWEYVGEDADTITKEELDAKLLALGLLQNDEFDELCKPQ